MKDVKRQAVDNRSGRDPLLHFLLTTSLSLFRGSLSLSLVQSSSCSGPCSACPRLSTSFLSIYLSLSFLKTNAGLRPLLCLGHCSSRSSRSRSGIGSSSSSGNSICRLLNGGNIDYGNKTTAKASRNIHTHTHTYTIDEFRQQPDRLMASKCLCMCVREREQKRILKASTKWLQWQTKTSKTSETRPKNFNIFKCTFFSQHNDAAPFFLCSALFLLFSFPF